MSDLSTRLRALQARTQHLLQALGPPDATAVVTIVRDLVGAIGELAVRLERLEAVVRRLDLDVNELQTESHDKTPGPPIVGPAGRMPPLESRSSGDADAPTMSDPASQASRPDLRRKPPE
jgi:hypothetical protein